MLTELRLMNLHVRALFIHDAESRFEIEQIVINPLFATTVIYDRFRG